MELSRNPPSWMTITEGDLEWIDIQDPTKEDTDLLARRFPFHPLNLEDSLSKRQLTRVEDHGDHLFILVHFPAESKDGLISRNQLTMFVGRNFVVTLHGAILSTLRGRATSLSVDGALRSSTLTSSPQLVHSILDELVDGIFPLLNKLSADLDIMEGEVFNEKVSPAARISKLRRTISDLRRIVAPLNGAVSDAWAGLKQYSPKDLGPYFQDLLDHTSRAAEVVEGFGETIEIYKDTNYLLSSDKTNRVLTVLTIIFTLTIPAALIAGIYGMNVALPLGNGQNPPDFFGPFTSFIILILLMLIPAGMMTWYFRRLGWF